MNVESLTELFRFFSKNEDLLYVGDESILPLACDNSKAVVHICLDSSGFRSKNLKVIEKNPMSEDIGEQGPFDSLVNNLEVDVMRSFQALERLLPLLKENGRVLMRVEPHGRSDEELRIVLDTLLHDYSLKTVDSLDLDKKKYIIAEKM
jgi:hypothetical protein